MAKKKKNYTSYRVLENGAKTTRPQPPKKVNSETKENQNPNSVTKSNGVK